MITSYFFIPATHPNLAEKLSTIQADHFIIDLEDTIKESDLQRSIEIISELKNPGAYYLRPPLFRQGNLDKKLFETLLFLGFRKILVPKFRSLSQIREIEVHEGYIIKDSVSYILVVENPESLLSINEILSATQLNVVGVGFGSHDYCAETGMKHESQYLSHARFMINFVAKAHKIHAIDIACMQIKDQALMRSEILDAFSFGFDAKFFIHPIQIEVLNAYNFYSAEEVDFAHKALEFHQKNGKPAVYSFQGRVVEPPHIKQFQKIKKWSDQHGNK